MARWNARVPEGFGVAHCHVECAVQFFLSDGLRHTNIGTSIPKLYYDHYSRCIEVKRYFWDLFAPAALRVPLP